MERLEQILTSIEVAEMVGKEHKEMLRDVRRYSQQLAESKIALGEFFTESTYNDANNQERPCFNVTKKGCEFIAHKITGTKGAEFTAKYINRFHEMEEQVKTPVALPVGNQIQLIAQGYVELETQIASIDEDLQTFKLDMPLLALEIEKISNAVKKRGVNVLGGKESNSYNDKSIRSKVYSDIHREIRRQFGVNTFKAIKRNQVDRVISLVERYEAPMILNESIKNFNCQLSL